MKKLVCILAGAALLGACEQKTEVVTPASTNVIVPTPPPLSETGQKVRKTTTDATSAVSTASSPATTETKTESTTTTTTASPNP